jgi:cytochrome c oxidase cbb3-type subunit 3
MTWGIGIAVLVMLAVTLYTIARANRYLAKRVLQFEAAKSGVTLPAEVDEAAIPEGEDFWTRMRKKYWEDAVPIEREAEIDLGHAYDGIRELDNRLPPWWVNMFLITIVWAFGYMYFYHWSSTEWSSDMEYKTEMAVAKKEVAMALAGKANAVDESNVTALTDGGAIGEGELIFKNVCAACHGQKGEGTVGPNLTDEQWLHGGGIKNVFKTIKYGVPEKGMIAWQAQLKPAEMQKVASYILTLKGTNPPNPKEPQGTVWVDSTAAATPAPAQ